MITISVKLLYFALVYSITSFFLATEKKDQSIDKNSYFAYFFAQVTGTVIASFLIMAFSFNYRVGGDEGLLNFISNINVFDAKLGVLLGISSIIGFLASKRYSDVSLKDAIILSNIAAFIIRIGMYFATWTMKDITGIISLFVCLFIDCCLWLIYATDKKDLREEINLAEAIGISFLVIAIPPILIRTWFWSLPVFYEIALVLQ